MRRNVPRSSSCRWPDARAARSVLPDLALYTRLPVILSDDRNLSAIEGNDPTAALTIENLIKEIHSRLHTATVLVTHDIPQAIRFNTDTMVIVEGAVLACGNIQDLVDNTNNVTLQKFFKGELTGQDTAGEAPEKT